MHALVVDVVQLLKYVHSADLAIGCTMIVKARDVFLAWSGRCAPTCEDEKERHEFCCHVFHTMSSSVS